LANCANGRGWHHWRWKKASFRLLLSPWRRSAGTASSMSTLVHPPLAPPRGTHDIEGAQLAAYRFVIETARCITARYAFQELETPIFESTQVFQRSLGLNSDVVMKEMYTFNDKGDNSLTLRPEGTAGVVRAFVTKKDFGDLPRRYFYSGPMFRYERPQKGRLRQFHQVGVENLGTSSPGMVVDVIHAAASFLRTLKLTESCQLEVNSLGDAESRERYQTSLREYLSTQKALLTTDSVLRLERGSVMRVLDSKDVSDQQVVLSPECPILSDYLSNPSREHFHEVCELLKQLDISFRVNPRLVRGLDYYNHTVFEFVGKPTPQLGPQQGTLLAGGAYNSLVSLFGGPPIPGVGWAAGVERLALLLDPALVPEAPRPIYVIVVTSQEPGCDNPPSTNFTEGENTLEIAGYAMRVSAQIRQQGYIVMQTVGTERALRKWLKKASKAHAAAVALVGSAEFKANSVTVKIMDTGDQHSIGFHHLEEALKQHLPHLSK